MLYWRSPYAQSSSTCSPSDDSDLASTATNSAQSPTAIDARGADADLITWVLNTARHTASEIELLSAIWRGYKEFTEGCAATRLSAAERRHVGEMCFRCVEMLKSCSYPIEDILCLFAVAAASLTTAHKEPLGDIDVLINTTLAQVFLAHCWLFDEACPIKEWHEHIFADTCSHASLNDAVMALFRAHGWQFTAPPALVAHFLVTLVPRNVRALIQHRVLALTGAPSNSAPPATIHRNIRLRQAVDVDSHHLLRRDTSRAAQFKSQRLDLQRHNPFGGRGPSSQLPHRPAMVYPTVAHISHAPPAS